MTARSYRTPARRPDTGAIGQDVGEVIVIAETAKAIKVERTDDDEQSWIPKSALDKESEVEGMGDRGILIIPRWLAEKIGWCDSRGYTTRKS